ncbi:SUF system NifU family Fe-S cluster assembly protein [Candidatus Gottesmanbacteria bacterium]|nr:SUF system NifU family Fe-S cluster assembly protein [Candidatus Gottesmanbacteria bacterium]
MDNLYRDNILDHYKNPRNFGILSDPSVISEEENPSCGDRIKIQIRIKELPGKKMIEDIRFSGEGCAISIASASLLTDFVKGKTKEEVLTLKTEDILKLLGTVLTPARIKCATLPLEVVHKTLLLAKV